MIINNKSYLFKTLHLSSIEIVSISFDWQVIIKYEIMISIFTYLTQNKHVSKFFVF